MILLSLRIKDASLAVELNVRSGAGTAFFNMKLRSKI